MKVILDPRKSILENTVVYREEAKKYRLKAAGAEKAIGETMRAIEGQQQVTVVKTKRKNQWFDKLHHFTTSNGVLVVGGKSAKQNDVVFAKHLLPNEYFLHADIRGSPAVVIKSPNPSPSDFQEAAEFTASYSSAWKRNFGSIDVYGVKGENVRKHFQGGYLDQGAFSIIGERQWFKNTLLGLYICLDSNTLAFCVKSISAKPSGLWVKLTPGKMDRQRASKTIKAYFAKKLFEAGKKVKLDEEEIDKLLPGDCEVSNGV